MARQASMYADFVTALLCVAMQAWVPSACAAEHPQGESANISKRFEPPFPFDASELWAKLARVTALRGEDMTPALIDSIFEVKLRPPKDPSASPEVPVFSVIAHVDWYYSIVLMMYPNDPQFFFQWGKDADAPRVPFPGPEGGICVDSNTVLPTLETQGWNLRSVDEPFTRGEPSRPVRTYSFAAGNESLSARFGPRSNCLLSIDIMQLR